MNINKPFDNIVDLSLKYLFNDKESEYNGQYFNYDLIEETLKQPSKDMILFKVTDSCKQEVYEIKLSYENDTFLIVSEYLDDEDLSHTLECFLKDNEIILYKKFGDGDLYLHIEYGD